MNTRPILDRIKKSLFSILESSTLILDARVADLYAGTGTQGIEALSRGAESCLFVEKRADAVKLLEENLAKTKLSDKATVRCGTVTSILQTLLRQPTPQLFDLILYDPPFSKVREESTRSATDAELALAGRLLYPGHARLVLRCERKAPIPQPEGLKVVRSWDDGPHAFHFFSSDKSGQKP
jgi:16S rRNA (guanine966-N2)-methyltransferase